MKKLPLVLIVFVVLVVGLGFYRGWFALSSHDTETNKVDVNLTVDRGKVKEDVEEMKDKAKELAHKTTAEGKDLADRGRDKLRSK